MAKKQENDPDRDLLALSDAVTALKRSSSRRMLLASLAFINDYFVGHPSPELPEHLREDDA